MFHLAEEQEQQRGTVFQAEGTANAEAGKCEEHSSLGRGRMKVCRAQDRELTFETNGKSWEISKSQKLLGQNPISTGEKQMSRSL